MDEKKYRLHTAGAGTVSVPARDAERLLALGDGDAALLYLYVLHSGGTLDIPRAAAELRRTEPAVLASARVLGKAGLLSAEEEPLPPAEELPEYTAGDIIARSREDAAFKALVGEAQRVLGHSLSGADLKTLFGIYDRLGMSGEVIMLMINHCAARLKKRYGEGRLPTMHAVEKEAFRWARQEIFTLAQAEDYIAQADRREEEEAGLMRALQITGRAPTPTERKYMEKWLGMGYGAEALAMAYDRTVVSTGKLVWAYMDKIVCSWYDKGLFTPRDIEKGDARRTERRQPAAPAAPEDDDSQRLLEQLRSKG